MTCPRCRSHVDRAQPSGRRRGAWIAYPCLCWLTPGEAQGLPETYRERTSR